MIRFKYFIIFVVLMSDTFMTIAETYNSVIINNYSVKLSKDRIGYVIVDDLTSGEVSSCKISHWDKRLSKGAGMISLTSDEIGILLYPGSNYIKVSEVLSCNGNLIQLYNIPNLDSEINSVADVNFNKKVFLSLYLIDVSSSTYQAKVSYFGNENNLMIGRGFWDESVKEVNITDDVFPVTDDFYIGKISLSGQYVAPNDLNCSLDSFPGVWDVTKRMKVVLPSDKDDSIVDSKCRELFSGVKTLNELGGELIATK